MPDLHRSLPVITCYHLSSADRGVISFIITTTEVPTMTYGERLIICDAEAKVVKAVIGDPVAA